MYSLKQIAQAYGRPQSTTCRHVKELVKNKLFFKKTRGKYYNEKELEQLEKLLDFIYPRK